jgi:hypothetical protein
MNSIAQLIEKMTQNEKRYFVRMASFHNSAVNNYYFQLYEDYTKGTNHSKKWSVSKLTATKHQLHNQLLQSLRNYHEQNNPRKIALNHLESYRILQNKGLLEIAKKELLKGEKHLVNYPDKTIQLLYLEEKKQHLVRQSNAEKLESKRIERNEELKQIMQSIQQNTLLTSYYLEAEYLNKKYEGTRSNMELNELHQLIYKIEAIQIESNPENNLLQGFALGILYYLYGQYQKSSTHFISVRNSLKERKSLLQKYEELYLRSLANICLNQIHQTKDLFIDAYKQDIIQQHFQDHTLEKLKLYLLGLINMMQANKNQNYALAFEEYQKLETEISSIKNWGNQENTYLTFQLTIALIGLKKEKEANKILYHFIHNPINQLKTDALITARIIFIGFKWVQKEHFFVDNELRSLERFLQLKGKYYATEKQLLLLFKKELINLNRTELKSLLSTTILTLQELQTLPEEKNAFLYFDYLHWLQLLESFIE